MLDAGRLSYSLQINLGGVELMIHASAFNCRKGSRQDKAAFKWKALVDTLTWKRTAAASWEVYARVGQN